ncbi:hypothetical protein BOX15_Mlig019802g2 [Macrostomum lignano]|uniref:EGF-like domain-containing protein n=3 Tax=Macrostomum lignano TaxID=282301 RepID=A0A267DDQ8_9PLAT|nr:hypothetical protein BOX15_Mlig019802g3 [Macrostomum lignano]PAA50330.1 hypothetical protein BOX15_Mlig019802g2 [Macrostomum lignano]
MLTVVAVSTVSLLLAVTPAPVNGQSDFLASNSIYIHLRQCRWAPHTARGENGHRREVSELSSGKLSAMFKFDEQEDWVDYTDSKANLRTDNLLPKWIFRNSGVQALLGAILLVDKVSLDREKPESVMYITPWNILLCGVYKFHSERNLYDTIVTNVLEEEKKLVDLIDLVYRLGLCAVNQMKESCPSNCLADEAVVTNCSNVANIKLGVDVNCFTELEVELQYHPFRKAEVDKITYQAFAREIDDFREWHSTLPVEKRIPMEIFDENLRSHKLVLFIIKELLANDPDEKPVTIDDQYAMLQVKFLASGCLRDDEAVHKRNHCFRFRAVLHLRLVELQKQLVAKRNCICALGFHWDPERESCQKRLLGYCHEQNVCLNGGICQASVRKSTNRNALGVASEEIVILCTCSAAWRGERCELENDVCQNQASTSTCGDHICQRDPDVEHGFTCICPPETHVRISEKDPRCRDINECSERNPELNPLCKNDGECENHNPGFICKCRHGYSGPRCEYPPDPPSWSSWEDWSKCILPDKALACMESPMQVRIRRCESKGFAQHCEGPKREIRFLCPGQMNNWDTMACSRYRGNVTHREVTGYSRLDYLAIEEFGKFSAHELELVLADSLSSYMRNFGLLSCTMGYCLLTPVLVGWCLWRILRSKIIASRLAGSSIAAGMQKQRQAAKEEAEKEAAVMLRRAAIAQEKARRRRAAKREDAEALEQWSQRQLEEACWELATMREQREQLREKEEQERRLVLAKMETRLVKVSANKKRLQRAAAKDNKGNKLGKPNGQKPKAEKQEQKSPGEGHA